jgi:hypothetical protein
MKLFDISYAKRHGRSSVRTNPCALSIGWKKAKIIYMKKFSYLVGNFFSYHGACAPGNHHVVWPCQMGSYFVFWLQLVLSIQIEIL